MSTYSNRLEPALQNLLQCVVRFFHPRSSCTTTHISANVQRITNIKCVVHDDLEWKNWITRYILSRHWLYEWFSQFHRLIRFFQGAIELFLQLLLEDNLRKQKMASALMICCPQIQVPCRDIPDKDVFLCFFGCSEHGARKHRKWNSFSTAFNRGGYHVCVTYLDRKYGYVMSEHSYWGSARWCVWKAS